MHQFDIDVNEEINNLENSIRGILDLLLQRKHGAEWYMVIAITQRRVPIWKERLREEQARMSGTPLDQRLIYYSDLSDLANIIDSRWDDVSCVFGKKKETQVLLDFVLGYRNAVAHSRDLREYQKHLLFGITREIRTRISKYKSRMHRTNGMNTADFFPQIELASDSIGSTSPGSSNGIADIFSDSVVAVGDTIEINISVVDPLGSDVEYKCEFANKLICDWSSTCKFTVTFTNEHVGLACRVLVLARSTRQHHAYEGYDCATSFYYKVMPDYNTLERPDVDGLQ